MNSNKDIKNGNIIIMFVDSSGNQLLQYVTFLLEINLIFKNISGQI